jgi:hypothetical protein
VAWLARGAGYKFDMSSLQRTSYDYPRLYCNPMEIGWRSYEMAWRLTGDAIWRTVGRMTCCADSYTEIQYSYWIMRICLGRCIDVRAGNILTSACERGATTLAGVNVSALPVAAVPTQNHGSRAGSSITSSLPSMRGRLMCWPRRLA